MPNIIGIIYGYEFGKGEIHMKKNKLLTIATALLLTVSMTACGTNKTTVTTEPSTEVTESTVAEPVTVTVEDLKPLTEKGVIVGVQDMKVSEGAKMNLVDNVVVDKKIVTNITCKDNTDYSKAGTYDAVFTITFNSDELNKFVKDNKLELNFKADKDIDSVRVTVKVTVEVLTKEEADKAVENGDDSVVTEETVAKVQQKNQETAKNNGNNNAVSGGNITHDEPKPAEKPAKPNKPAEKPAEKPSKPAEKPSKPAEKPAEPTQPQHQHNFDYKVTVVTQPTCTSAGVERHTCSCGEHQDRNLPATNHAWHHHDEQGHYENITEDVYEYHTICNQCGKDFGPGEEGADAAILHLNDKCHNYRAEEVKVGTQVVGKNWIVDAPAYDQCDKCGARK